MSDGPLMAHATEGWAAQLGGDAPQAESHSHSDSISDPGLLLVTSDAGASDDQTDRRRLVASNDSPASNGAAAGDGIMNERLTSSAC